MGSVVFVIGFAAMLIWDIQMVMSARKAAAARTGTLTSDQG
jgi:hypothetical protein